MSLLSSIIQVCDAPTCAARPIGACLSGRQAAGKVGTDLPARCAQAGCLNRQVIFNQLSVVIAHTT